MKISEAIDGMIITINNQSYEIELERKGNKFFVKINHEENIEVTPEFNQFNELQAIIINNKKYWVNIKKSSNKYLVNISNNPIEVYILDSQKTERIFYDSRKIISITAPMSGLIVKLATDVGKIVKKNDHLLTIEAMKMQNEILSPIDGKIIARYVNIGEKVEKDRKLLVIEQLK
ncbi:MAG: acetyl-CoA carboxylase biotin carboxyl carrier protein subunit [candidate division WOR-3 bacterium]|nr:acetyl-CoA carboxylase biotin carboxyl carrier protein subunit [candidate division WOR-3 bacterium]